MLSTLCRETVSVIKCISMRLISRIKDVTQAIENAFQDPNMGHTAIVRLQDIVGREKTESEGDQPISRDWKQFFVTSSELLRRDARTRRRVRARS